VHFLTRSRIHLLPHPVSRRDLARSCKVSSKPARSAVEEPQQASIPSEAETLLQHHPPLPSVEPEAVQQRVPTRSEAAVVVSINKRVIHSRPPNLLSEPRRSVSLLNRRVALDNHHRSPTAQHNLALSGNQHNPTATAGSAACHLAVAHEPTAQTLTTQDGILTAHSQHGRTHL
jgi:hypothetical protein